MASNNDTQILTLTENSNAHGTEMLIQRLNQEAGVVEVVYTLGDAGGYLGVIDSIAVIEDEDGDFGIERDTDGMFWGSREEAVEAARQQLAREAA